MTKIRRASLSSIVIAIAFTTHAPLRAQAVNASQQVTVQGLRSVASHGNFTAVHIYAPDGSLYLPTAISGANAAEFAVSTSCSTTVLTANSSCTLTVTSTSGVQVTSTVTRNLIV